MSGLLWLLVKSPPLSWLSPASGLCLSSPRVSNSNVKQDTALPIIQGELDSTAGNIDRVYLQAVDSH